MDRSVLSEQEVAAVAREVLRQLGAACSPESAVAAAKAAQLDALERGLRGWLEKEGPGFREVTIRLSSEGKIDVRLYTEGAGRMFQGLHSHELGIDALVGGLQTQLTEEAIR